MRILARTLITYFEDGNPESRDTNETTKYCVGTEDGALFAPVNSGAR